jgi:predicted Zn-dependent protease
MIEGLNLDDVHEIMNRQLDEGATFAQLKCHHIKSRRNFTWHSGKLISSFKMNKQVWVLRSFNNGAWGVIVSNSFNEIKETAGRSARLARDIANRMGASSKVINDIMVSKPIRQLRALSSKEFIYPENEEVLLFLRESENIGPANSRYQYLDSLIDFHYWDSEHTRGVKEYFNVSLDMNHFNESNDHSISNLSLCSTHNTDIPFNYSNLNWQPELQLLGDTLKQESFRGPSPEDMPWVFSPKAFAQLLYHTLGPTICLERPDPFIDSLNPASIDGSAISSEKLTVHSSPNIFSDKPFLDQEGIPAKKMCLINKGIFQNLLLTRQSAFHLNRSLSIHKKKILAGSSRSSIHDNSIKPDLQFIEIEVGDGIEEYEKKGHVYIPHLEIHKVHTHGNTFSLTAKNCLVTKYGGLHKRHLQRMHLIINRDDLWHRLLAVGNNSQTVHIKQNKQFYSQETYSTFQTPGAVFKGAQCSWN